MRNVTIFLIAATLIGGMAGCGEPVVDNPPKMMGYNIIVEDTIAGCVVSGEQFNLEVGVDDDYGVKSVRIDIPSAGIEKNLKEIDGSWYLDNTIKLPEKGNYDLKITATDTSDQTSILEGSIFCGEPHDLCDCYCQQATPGGEVRYEFGGPRFSEYAVVVNWTDTPKLNDAVIYPALQFHFDNWGVGDVGPQIEVSNSGETIERKVIFSIWDMSAEQDTAHPFHGNCYDVEDPIEGNCVRCTIDDYNWEEGKNYKLTVQKDKELADGVVWNATITKDPGLETAVETLIGRIKLDDQEGYDGYGLLNGTVGGFWKYYSGSNNECLEAEHGKIIRIGPVGTNLYDDKWLPRIAGYDYEDIPCIRGTTNFTELGVIVQEVGAGVERGPEYPLTDILWSNGFEDILLSSLPQQIRDLFE